jgi:hypothetical protein
MKQQRVEYLFQHINQKKASKMSDFCKLAHTTYQIWKNEGREKFKFYLQTEIGCPAKHAGKIAKNYNPDHPPVEICPIDSIGQGSEQIFQDMALYIEDIWPHNLLAWYLKRHIFGEDTFDFELVGDGKESNKILFPQLIKSPDGHHLPFGLAALDVIEVGELPAHVVKKAQVLIDKLDSRMGIDLTKTLLEARFIFPPSKVLEQLVETIKRGLKGEVIVFTGAFCPDYSYEETGRKDIPYRYTFDNVGVGVGLVAQQFQRVLPFLTDFMSRWGINYRIQLGIGDFEARSEEILRRVGVDEKEFIQRCKKSLEAFDQALPEIEMDLRLFDEGWANGRFSRYIKEATVRLSQADFGQIKTNTGKDPRHEIRFIAKDGQDFYRRWFGDSEMSLKEIEKKVTEQLAEYVAVGKVFKEDFENLPFIAIAGDRPKMQIGGNFESNHPILCCKRVY